ncbi:MAG: hypothetical protein IPQ07_37405 [Myxococcales bacterium]|nr:hypothetical protein [Myxococcales bacterium]
MKSIVLVLLVACHASTASMPSRFASAPGMGNAHHEIQTTSAAAQHHFDAGLDALYAFNYDEAGFEFSLATRADAGCAMCAWGIAMASASNINDVDKQGPAAHEAAMRAKDLATRPVERALAAALVERLPMGEVTPQQRDKLALAYAQAMRAIAKQYDDDDVHVWFAEAALLATPRDLPMWSRDRKPSHPHVIEAQAAIEHVLARSPEHVGAIHFYIHVMDGGPDQARAMPFADKLGRLAPGAGHLVHMPSHLYLPAGRYRDADDANRHAIAADRTYLAISPPGGAYAMFTMHPVHFLWHVLLWEGDQAGAEEQAKQLTSHHQMMGDPAGAEFAATFAPLTAARFGLWDAALALPAPGGPFSGVFVHYARALALISKGRFDDVPHEVEALRAAVDLPLPVSPMAPPPPPEVVAKTKEMLGAIAGTAAAQVEGALAVARGDLVQGIETLTRAVELESKLVPGGEPPEWPLPARQRLGAVLLTAGRAKDAELAYREDLKEHPENGWSLFGLATALDAQHAPEAKAVWDRFHTAWSRSQLKLTSSVF